MTKNNLHIVDGRVIDKQPEVEVDIHPEVAADSELSSFRQSLDDLMAERHTEIVSRIQKWIMFWADFGYTQLNLEDFPMAMSKDDIGVAVAWLRSEGIKVTSPRWSGRTIIDLQAKQ